MKSAAYISLLVIEAVTSAVYPNDCNYAQLISDPPKYFPVDFCFNRGGVYQKIDCTANVLLEYVGWGCVGTADTTTDLATQTEFNVECGESTDCDWVMIRMLNFGNVTCPVVDFGLYWLYNEYAAVTGACIDGQDSQQNDVYMKSVCADGIITTQYYESTDTNCSGSVQSTDEDEAGCAEWVTANIRTLTNCNGDGWVAEYDDDGHGVSTYTITTAVFVACAVVFMQ